jgi:predicted Zn-dependent protease
MVIAPDLAQFGQQASEGLGLLFLKFGRDAERESDGLGVEYSSKIGYDAQQMAGFFNTLERKSAGQGEELPDFLSTHPNPGDRNTAVAKKAVEWKQQLNLTNPQINRNTYLKRIEGLIYGEDPKQGFVENKVFYHPVLKFQFPIPTNWSFQNSPQMVQMAPKDGKAIMNMTLIPGKSLQEAATEMLKQYGLKAVESRNITVNGLNAISIIADQAQQEGEQQQQATIRTLSYIIQYGGVFYHLIGVSSVKDFNTYVPSFTNTMQNFRELKDAAKLAKMPERIRIKTVAQSATLNQVLLSLKMDSKRLEELAILNGMKLTDRVEKGTLIKVVGF